MISFSQFGDGAAHVILHGGWLDRHHMIDALEPVLSRRSGYRRLYPDMPGHGTSPGEGVTSYGDALDRLADFVDQEVPDGPLLFTGESRGGYFARALARLFMDRVAGLCLIVPADNPHPDPADLAPAEVRVADPRTRATLPEKERPRFDRLATQSAELADRIRRTKLPAVSRTDPDWQAMAEAHWKLDPDPDAAEPPLRVPALIILGRQDGVAGFSRMLARINAYPYASVAVLDCAGHAPAWERPGVVAALLDDWLDRVETAQPQ